MLRQGNIEDFEAIVSINRAVTLDVDKLDDPDYRARVQQDGFLLPGELTVETFQADLPGYIIAEEEGKILGYLCLHGYQSWETQTIDAVDCLMPGWQSIYFAEPHAYIHKVAIDRESQSRGTATSLLREAEDQVRDREIPWLFSMIVISPVTNVSSMLFHEKNGFKRVVQTRPARAADLDGFANLLYGKRLD